jgi:superoxide reductase
MKLFVENTTDAAQEKHVPVVEGAGEQTKVKVGSAAHPMVDEHYIEWIELMGGDHLCRVYLKPGESPEALFNRQKEGVTARAYCNLHGLWKS